MSESDSGMSGAGLLRAQPATVWGVMYRLETFMESHLQVAAEAITGMVMELEAARSTKREERAGKAVGGRPYSAKYINPHITHHTMMGDRDYRSLIKNSIDSLGRELDVKVDSTDHATIHLEEVVGCLRRSYFNRRDPLDQERHGFSELLSGLLRKLGYGAEQVSYDMGDVNLKGNADMLVDDAVILFRPAIQPRGNPRAGDLLYLNACLWMYDKPDGIIVYITGDRRESSFSLTRNKKMFEETVRRVRVLTDLLPGDKLPILEPSDDCEDCQYYQRCYTKRKASKQVTLASMLGLGKDAD